jgi:hypothetical protein
MPATGSDSGTAQRSGTTKTHSPIQTADYAIVVNELLRLDFLGRGHRRSVGPSANSA